MSASIIPTSLSPKKRHPCLYEYGFVYTSCRYPNYRVTGTRGKTSVTSMIADILQHAGKKVLLGGNLRGISTLAQLPTADQFDIAVLELDSWQLQGFDAMKISPHIAVFTTFYPDHMNYYDGDIKRYMRDKTAIFRHQKKGDVLVLSRQVADLTHAERADRDPSFGSLLLKPLPSSFKMQIPGAHNLLNAALAKAATKACDIDDATIETALQNFAGVEGRLQFVGTWQDRNFYNDSNATTQEATLAALMSFDPQSIVLIWGGADKSLPIDQLLKYIYSWNIRSVLIQGSGSDRVLQQLPNIPTAATMSEAVDLATRRSTPHDNVILSPAFASFGAFNNEYDRSDQFMHEVKNLIAAARGFSCPH